MVVLEKGYSQVLHKTKKHSKLCEADVLQLLMGRLCPLASMWEEKGPETWTSTVSNSLALSLGWNVFTNTEGGAMCLWPLSVL